MSNKNFERVLQGLNEAADIAEGKADPKSYRIHVPYTVDVKAIRSKLRLTQKEFAARYGFTIGAVRDWEQERRQPEVSARILLKVVEKHPNIVEDVLGAVA